MDDFGYQWPYTSMTQPRETGIGRLNAISALSAQVETLSRKLDILAVQRTQSVDVFCDYCAGNHPSQQCTISYGPVQYGGDYFNNYAYPDNYHRDWGYHPNDAWSYTQQDQYYAPSHMYPPEFSCPPPLQQEEKSNLLNYLSKSIAEKEKEIENFRLKELLSKFMASNDEMMSSQANAIRNLEDQMEKMFEALNNSPQNTWAYDMDSETDEVPEPNLQLDETQEIEMEEESGDKVITVSEVLYECSNEDEPILFVPQEPFPPKFKIPIGFAKPCPLGSHVVGNAPFNMRASSIVEPWWVEEEKIEEEPIVFDEFKCPNIVTNTMEEAPSFLTVQMGNLPTKSKLGDLDFMAITNGNLPNNELLPMDGGFLKYRRGIG